MARFPGRSSVCSLNCKADFFPQVWGGSIPAGALRFFFVVFFSLGSRAAPRGFAGLGLRGQDVGLSSLRRAGRGWVSFADAFPLCNNRATLIREKDPGSRI